MVGQSEPDPVVAGDVWRRGDEGYEAARQAAVWHRRKPDRYPDVIVRVNNEQDVVKAVRLAREQGLKVDVICPSVTAYLEKHPEYADLIMH